MADRAAPAWAVVSLSTRSHLPDAGCTLSCAVMKWLCLLVATVMTVYVVGAEFGHIAWLGFPDGHRTEYDLAQIALLRYSFIPALMIATVAVVLALRRSVRWSWVAILVVLGLSVVVAVVVTDSHNYAVMDHGQGD